MTSNVIDIIIRAKNVAYTELAKTNQQLIQLQNIAGMFVSGTGLAAIALGLKNIAAGAYELGAASAQLTRMRTSFADLASAAGAIPEQVLSALSTASRGAISNQALVAAANRAILLEVADTSGEMVALLDVAIARGKAMGLPAEQAFNDIILGIGRMSPLILDNLGIVTDAERTFETYAATLGKSSTELTNVERKQALLNRVLEESVEIVALNKSRGDDLALSFERLAASSANTKQALGDFIAPVAAAVAASYAKDLDLITEALQRLAGGAEEPRVLKERLFELGAEITAISAAINEVNSRPGFSTFDQNELVGLQFAIQAIGEEYNATAAQLGTPLLDVDSLTAGIVEFTAVSQDAAVAILQLGTSTDSTVLALQHLANMAAQASPNIDALRFKILDLVEAERAFSKITGDAVSQLRSSFKGVVGELGVDAAISQFTEAEDRVNTTVALMRALGADEIDVEFTAAGIVDQYRNANNELGKAPAKVKEVNEALEALKSAVGSVLADALNVDVGVDTSDLLPYEDKVNEDARRLADVAVNGFASPWAEYLNNKFPGMFGEAFEGGDIKGQAAKLLRDFEDGLNTDLIDKEKAKERIKRMLFGDANMKELAAQITAELAEELGTAAPGDLAAQVEQALGVGDKAAGGASAGAGFGTGAVGAIATADVGGAMVGLVVQQVDNNAANVRVSGASTGKLWGTAFLSTVGANVPFQLVQILVGFVLPEVLAAIARAKSTTGTTD